jgi:hypothetical protein
MVASTAEKGTACSNMNCPGTPQRMKKTASHPRPPSPPWPAGKRGALRRPPTGLSPQPPRPAKKSTRLQQQRQIPGPRPFIWRCRPRICQPTRAPTTRATWDGGSGMARFRSRPATRSSSTQNAQNATRLAAKTTYELPYLLRHLSVSIFGRHRRRRGSGLGRSLWSPL